MKNTVLRALALGGFVAASLSLSACNSSPTEQKADAIENTADAVRESADATADAMEKRADALDPKMDGKDTAAEKSMDHKADVVRP